MAVRLTKEEKASVGVRTGHEEKEFMELLRRVATMYRNPEDAWMCAGRLWFKMHPEKEGAVANWAYKNGFGDELLPPTCKLDS